MFFLVSESLSIKQVADPPLLIVWGIKVELTAAVGISEAQFDWVEILLGLGASLDGAVHYVNIVKAVTSSGFILT